MTYRHAEQSFGCACWLPPTLLPVLKRAVRDTQQPGKLLLRQPDPSAGLCSRRHLDRGDTRGLAAPHLLDGQLAAEVAVP